VNRTSDPNPVAATTYGRVEGVRRGGVCTFLAQIATCAYPKLVVSGGNSPVFDLMSQSLADGIGGRLVTLPGEMHSPQRLGPAFNDELEEHLRIAGAPQENRE
jgi:hypothetical protein